MHTQPNIHMPKTPAVKTYVATLTQDSTNAPVATILQNTIGNIVWTRDDVGYYKGTLTGAFPNNKRHVLITSGGNYTDSANQYIDIFAYWGPSNDEDNIYLASEYNGQASDGQMGPCPIEIKIYS